MKIALALGTLIGASWILDEMTGVSDPSKWDEKVFNMIEEENYSEALALKEAHPAFDLDNFTATYGDRLRKILGQETVMDALKEIGFIPFQDSIDLSIYVSYFKTSDEQKELTLAKLRKLGYNSKFFKACTDPSPKALIKVVTEAHRKYNCDSGRLPGDQFPSIPSGMFADSVMTDAFSIYLRHGGRLDDDCELWHSLAHGNMEAVKEQLESNWYRPSYGSSRMVKAITVMLNYPIIPEYLFGYFKNLVSILEDSRSPMKLIDRFNCYPHNYYTREWHKAVEHCLEADHDAKEDRIELLSILLKRGSVSEQGIAIKLATQAQTRFKNSIVLRALSLDWGFPVAEALLKAGVRPLMDENDLFTWSHSIIAIPRRIELLKEFDALPNPIHPDKHVPTILLQLQKAKGCSGPEIDSAASFLILLTRFNLLDRSDAMAFVLKAMCETKKQQKYQIARLIWSRLDNHKLSPGNGAFWADIFNNYSTKITFSEYCFLDLAVSCGFNPFEPFITANGDLSVPALTMISKDHKSSWIFLNTYAFIRPVYKNYLMLLDSYLVKMLFYSPRLTTKRGIVKTLIRLHNSHSPKSQIEISKLLDIKNISELYQALDYLISAKLVFWEFLSDHNSTLNCLSTLGPDEMFPSEDGDHENLRSFFFFFLKFLIIRAGMSDSDAIFSQVPAELLDLIIKLLARLT